MLERLKPLDGLDFNEDKHWYYLNGKFIPSVSSFLKPISSQVYGEIDSVVLQRAAERGNEVHLAIEVYETTGADIASDEIRGYFEAYKKFRADNPNLISIANEYRIYNSTLWYAGTVDAIYKNRESGGVVLVDFKTSLNVEKAMVIPQLTAYAEALKRHEILVNDTLVLHLKPDRTYEIVEIEKNFNVFVSCIAIQNHIKKTKNK